MCKECSHPCDGVGCIGKGKFYLLLVGLEVSNIKLVPFSIISWDCSTGSPIKDSSIVATEGIAILYAETEHDRLVGSYLDIELGNLLVGEFIDQIVSTARDDRSEVEPCWDGNSSTANYTIIASDGST